jgi:maltose O-acetyltransferase
MKYRAYPILLQGKFFLIYFVNLFYNFIPGTYLSNLYLRILGIKIGKGSKVHRGVKLFHIGNLKIGKNSVVNFGCYLDNRRGIYIGDNVGIAHNTKIYTLGHDLNDPQFKAAGKPVIIEDNAFIFSNSLIMPGVRIGEGAVILSGSVVTRDVEPYTVAGGNPAKKVKDRIKEINYKSKYQYWFAL